ncbi:MAG: phosphoglycerate mutase family protein [Deinococcales bacterium]
MARFLLIRHGQADYELAEIRRLKGLGRDLVPLTPAGVRQVEATATSLPALALLLSSPMTRALQTAAILAGRLGVPLQVEYELHEWLPDLTGTYDGVEAVRLAHEDYVRCKGEWPPGERRAWEPRSAVVSRATAVLRRYEHVGGHVGVVCHGVVIDALTGVSVETADWVEYSGGA